MIAYLLEQGDRLKPKVGQNMVGDIADCIFGGLPVTRLRLLLASDSPAIRAIGVHIIYAAGPYAKVLIEDVRALTRDDDPDVRHVAQFVMTLAVEYGWVTDA